LIQYLFNKSLVNHFEDSSLAKLFSGANDLIQTSKRLSASHSQIGLSGPINAQSIFFSFA